MKKIIKTSSTDPAFNLATEQWLFDACKPEDQILYLWINKPCIVIGRYQNPWEECRIPSLEEDGVLLQRRSSGGGAVYQDLGNVCFTFIGKKTPSFRTHFFPVVLDALASLGLEASLDGRNDVLVNGLKVSGSAFQVLGDKFIHHGTMLVDACLDKVPLYLTPDERKLESHGVKSVSSRIANLTDFDKNITVESFCNALIESFGGEVQDIGKSDLSKEAALDDAYKRYSSKDWCYGKTPNFSHQIKGRLSWGSVDIHLDVQGLKIKRVAVFSDSLSNENVENLQEILPSVEYGKSSMEALAKEIANPEIAEAISYISTKI